MKTVGIIAEYNPFHNGHYYLIEETKRLTGANYVIVVMSGDFVQRGFPALTDKYTRTLMALQNGVDLVIELPVYYATASAEFFARSAIALLDKLGITDIVSFGSECGDIQLLKDTSRLLAYEGTDYQRQLQLYLKKGLSFPQARSYALQDTVNPEKLPLLLPLLSSPNNILAIEYCKSILIRESSMMPFTLIRKGSDYHDTTLSSHSFSSATAIRTALETPGNISEIKPYVPPQVATLLSHSFSNKTPIHGDDFSSLLHYKLLLDAPIGYHFYLDVSADMSDKILKNLNNFSTFTNFCEILKSKDLTYTRISRCLIHILLNIRKEDMERYKAADYIFYARILGFKKQSGDLLHVMKQNSSLPLISKLADAHTLLSDIGMSLLEKDIQATHIYNSISASKYQFTYRNEYTKSMIVI